VQVAVKVALVVKEVGWAVVGMEEGEEVMGQPERVAWVMEGAGMEVVKVKVVVSWAMVVRVRVRVAWGVVEVMAMVVRVRAVWAMVEVMVRVGVGMAKVAVAWAMAAVERGVWMTVMVEAVMVEVVMVAVTFLSDSAVGVHVANACG
jgi:hypothetical protein